MHETIKKMAQVFEKQREQRRRACAVFTALAILVSLTTTYMLVQPANTMAVDYVCGMEAHTHSEECYRLICGYDDEAAFESLGGEDAEHEEDEAAVESPDEILNEEETQSEETAEEEPPIVGPSEEEEATVELPEVTEEPAVEEETQEEPVVEEPEIAPESEQSESTETQNPSAEDEMPVEPAPQETPVVEEQTDVPDVQEASAEQAPVVEETPAAPEASEAVSDAGSEVFSGTASMAMVMYTNGQETSEPAVEEVTAEEVAAEEVAVEEPAVEEPVVEEPVVEEPVVEEPVVEEPVVEEPVVEEVAVEEPAGEDPVAEESDDEEVAEEPSDETVVEEESEIEDAYQSSGSDKHIHTADCYELICELPEHEHSEDCMSLMNLLEDLGDLPEGYTNEYSVFGDGYTVAVFAPDGALPEGAELVATLLEEGDDAHATAEQTLEAMVAQEVEINVAGVMSEAALEEAAEPVAEDLDETVEEETQAPVEEEVMTQEPVEDESLAEGEVLTASLIHNDNVPEEAAETVIEVVEETEESVEEEVPEAVVTEEVTEEAEESVEEPVPYEEEFSYDGFVALDIHFELDGEEIEPARPVFVYINVEGLLPEDVDPESVAIQHHVEVKEEKSALQEKIEDLFPVLAEEPVVEFVELVADNSDNTGMVETVGLDVTTLFAVDSFSTFTVTYSQLKELDMLDTGDAVVFLADEIKANLSSFVRMSASDVQTDSENNRYLTLTSYTPAEVRAANPAQKDNRVDPYVTFSLGDEFNIDQFYKIAVAYKANDACDKKKMELYLLNRSEEDKFGPSEKWVARSPLVGNGEMQYVYFDLSKGNIHDQSEKEEHDGRVIDGFRLDFVKDSRTWSDNQYGEMDVYAIYLWYKGAATDQDVTDNSIEDIQFNLFDYSLWINKNKSANGTYTDNPIAQYFTFRGGSSEAKHGWNNTAGHQNTTTDKDGYTANHAKVKPVLGTDGFPILAANGASLNYLFNPQTTHHAVTAYSPTNTILAKEGTHYFYDSGFNAVDYDIYANQFNVRSYAERNSTTAGYARTDGNPCGDFHPFEYTEGIVLGNAASGIKAPYHVDSADVNYWYGMTMEFEFQMQNDGAVVVKNADGSTSEVPMVFEFSGDDDVWVFIDNVLVLDLGGTHGTVDGSINFQTGQILQYLTWNGANSTDEAKTQGTIDGEETGTSFPTTLKACYENAGKTPKGGWNANNLTFANYSTHTLKFFYLERGASVANCKLNFNMPIVPENALTVEKILDYADGAGADPKRDYTFRVLKTKNDADTVLGNHTYTVKDQSNATVGGGTTTADGLFTLKAGQKAVFEGLEIHAEETYKVQELIPQAYAQYYSQVSANNTVLSKNGTQKYGRVDYDVYTSGSQSFVEDGQAMSPTFAFTNRLQTEVLTITKNVVYTGGEFTDDAVFNMDVVVDKEKLPVGSQYILVNSDGTETTATVGTAGIVGIKNGQTAKLTMLYNSSYEVKETDASALGFYVQYEINGTVCDSDLATGKITENVAVTVTNTTGPELPNTGGIGTNHFTTLGTILMLGAGVLLLDQRRRREGTSAN